MFGRKWRIAVVLFPYAPQHRWLWQPLKICVCQYDYLSWYFSQYVFLRQCVFVCRQLLLFNLMHLFFNEGNAAAVNENGLKRLTRDVYNSTTLWISSWCAFAVKNVQNDLRAQLPVECVVKPNQILRNTWFCDCNYITVQSICSLCHRWDGCFSALISNSLVLYRYGDCLYFLSDRFQCV